MSQIDEMDGNMVESVLTPHSAGIKVLLAPPRPEMADFVTAENLQKVLEQLKALFDFVVVDTWTSLHDSVLTALDLSDQIVLLTTPDIPSLRNVRLFFEVTEQLEYPPEKISLVLNRFDKGKGRIRAKDIEESIKHPVAAELPFDEIVPLSVNQGVPFIISDSSRSVSQAVTRLAEQLFEKLVTEPEEDMVESEVQFDDAGRRRLGRFFS